jgi:4-hydroxythreonine-4-phosphate dehydrogenase
MSLPIVAVALGDPAGIGPEIALRAAAAARVRALCRPLLVGDARVLALHAKRLAGVPAVRRVEHVAEAAFADGAVGVLEKGAADLPDLVLGKTGAACGRASIAYLTEAVQLARAGVVHAVVAAPHTQSAVAAAGIAFDGNPSYVAQLTGTDPGGVFLMLCTETLRIVHVTLHVGLRQALDLVTGPRVEAAIRAADAALKDLGIARPRLAVAGVNPHAGEGGLFGREEIEVIRPAVAAARAAGIDAHGPFGADTMYLDKGYDAYVAMYHDQGHVPAKLLAFDRTVAVTIGTPIRFASVGHGSALDIAGKGVADPSALIAAILALCAGAAGKS